MTTTNTYGDPSIVTSPFRGIIPTIVDTTSVSQKNRNYVYIVGRAKVNAATINGLPNSLFPALVPSAPFSTGSIGMSTDEYLYFHLVFEPMAANNTPPSTTVVPGPSKLAFISLQNINSNFTPIPFILNTSGNPVAPGNIQPFTLTPV